MRQFIIIVCVLYAGSLTVRAQLTNSGNIRTFTGANVAIYGNLTNNGSIADSGTLVLLAGTNLQTIGGSSVTTFKNLQLNNTSTAGITLAQAMNVRGTLTFTDGYLNTTTTNILTLTATSVISGVSNNSFVSGPVIKTGNSAFTFPVGKNTVYAPISISAPASATDQFRSEYFQVSPDPLYPTWSREPALHHVSECEYWMLDRITGASNVTVTLSWDTRSCGVSVPNDLRVARWDGSQWTDQGNGGTTGSTAAGTIVTAAPVANFSPFTLASATSTNPLPVELIGFVSQCEDKEAVLRWSTASEFRNDFFSVESSTDAENWNTIAAIDGAGNTSVLTNYSWTDFSNPGRDSYYRLSQTDTDGKTTIHSIVYLESCLSPRDNKISLYPNPARSFVTLLSEEAVTSIQVMNPEGKAIGNIPIDTELKQIDFSEVADGVYFVRITTASAVVVEKVVVERK